MRNQIQIISIVIGFVASIFLFGRCSDDVILIDSIEIVPIGNDTLFSGKEYQLDVLLTPSAVDAPRLSWSVSDATIASVHYGGILKPMRGGDVTVYVTSLQSGGKKVSATRKFTILNSGIFLKDKAVTINPTEVRKMEYEFMPEDFKPEGEITWISENPDIATVDQNGNLRGIEKGVTKIKVRLGNPLSGFYSESSCLVTVDNFVKPTYTYENGILNFEQTVPGLLPIVAKTMPYFKKIILKGVINGTDMLFFIENNDKIDELDLGNAFVVKGGRTFEANPIGKFGEDDKIECRTDDNVLPYQFLNRLRIKRLVVPSGLTSPFSFCMKEFDSMNYGQEEEEQFVLDYLEFPDSYERIEIINCDVKKLKLSKNLKEFYCKTYMLNMTQNPFPEVIFKEKVELPKDLKKMYSLADFEQELVIPSSMEDIHLAGKIKAIIFEPNQTLKLDYSFVPKMKEKEDYHLLIETEKMVLPKGIESIGKKVLGKFFAGEMKLRGRDYGNSIQEIIFPETLKKIEAMAFQYVDFEKPVRLPEGLEELEHSAFKSAGMSVLYVPESITKIGDYAFADCKDLEEVHLKKATPDGMGADVFRRTQKMGKIEILYVPQGAKQAYVAAGFYKYFFKIEEE